MCIQCDTFSVFKEYTEYWILKVIILGRSRESMKKLKITTARTDYIIKYKNQRTWVLVGGKESKSFI